MSNLRGTIEELASQFAASVIDALRGASLDELLDVAGARGAARRARMVGAGAGQPGGIGVLGAKKRGNGGRLSRRSADDIAQMIDAIVELLEKHPEGMRAEQIRDVLSVEAKELPRPLTDALGSGRLTKTGQKRATTYFVGSGKGGAPAPRRRPRRGRRKKKNG